MRTRFFSGANGLTIQIGGPLAAGVARISADLEGVGVMLPDVAGNEAAVVVDFTDEQGPRLLLTNLDEAAADPLAVISYHGGDVYINTDQDVPPLHDAWNPEWSLE